MLGSDLRELVERTEYLLWVLARWDVEGVSTNRTQVLAELRGLEVQAAQWNAPDLYGQVMELGRVR